MNKPSSHHRPPIIKAICFLGFFGVASIGLHAQKAFEPAYYRGAVQGKQVRFTLADGYLAGSTLTVTDGQKRKATRYVPDQNGTSSTNSLRFIPEGNHFLTSATDYFVLDGMKQSYEHLPRKIYGYYSSKERRYRIVLSH